MFKEEVQALMQHHFHQFLNNTGFTLVKEYGDYDLNKFNPKIRKVYFIGEEK
ncbi:MAG: hypothetical protein IPP53_17445 [Bacteroidetes bacterium]|nr:hypothetical protein [Bacteroidota bacterium]